MKEHVFLSPVNLLADFIDGFAYDCLYAYSKQGNDVSLFPQGDGGLVARDTAIVWPDGLARDGVYAEARYRWTRYIVTFDADCSWTLLLTLKPRKGHFEVDDIRYAQFTAELAFLSAHEREPGRSEAKLWVATNPLWREHNRAVDRIFLLEAARLCETWWWFWRDTWYSSKMLTSLAQTPTAMLSNCDGSKADDCHEEVCVPDDLTDDEKRIWALYAHGEAASKIAELVLLSEQRVRDKLTELHKKGLPHRYRKHWKVKMD